MVDIGSFPRGVHGRSPRASTAPFAAWFDPRKLETLEFWRYQEGKVIVGMAEGGQLLGVKDDRHMLTVAGSRAGKGISAIVPNLISYPGSVLVIDPKGENARLTARRRMRTEGGLMQDVFVLDPFQVSGQPSASFNPVAMIDPKSETCIDDAALIAEALVIMETGGNARHFTSAARNLIRGLLLWIAAEEEPDKRNLIYLRRLLTLSQPKTELLLDAMAESDACYGVIARAANALRSKSENERSGVLSTAIEQTDFLDSPAMARTLTRSDFKLADLKGSPTTIYLCLPAGRMATHSRWFRVVINLALEAMERSRAKPKHPVLFIMDEFAILEHLSSVEKAAGQIAGFDVRLWPILQDLNQLKAIYSDRWETFMGNSGLMQFFGNADMFTLEYLEKRLGQSAIMSVSTGEISVDQVLGGFSGESKSIQSSPLMTAEEISRYFSRQSGAQIIVWPGADPIAMNRIKYFEHSYFKGKYHG
jgi:type IV secretion system protein VirD4